MNKNRQIKLSIKQHNQTNLMYFGKTSKNDINNYRGSGTYWTNHIKKHKYNVNTICIGTYAENDPKLVELALNFSIIFNIVESKEWANLILENGLDGGIHTLESKRHLSKVLTGIKRTDKTKQNMKKAKENISLETKRKSSISAKNRKGKQVIIKDLLGNIVAEGRQDNAFIKAGIPLTAVKYIDNGRLYADINSKQALSRIHRYDNTKIIGWVITTIKD